MAEASVDQARFFCHKCSQEIQPVLPDYLCPNCNGGFIEQMENDSTEGIDDSSLFSDERRPSFDSDTDPLRTLVFSTLWSEVLNDPSGPRQPRRPNPASSSSSSSTSPLSGPPQQSSSSSSSTMSQNARTPGATDSNRSFSMQAPGMRTTLTFHGGGAPGGRAPPPPDMIAFLHHFLGLNAANPTGPGGVHFPVHMFNVHGSPRDYAWGEGGLDAIITQLLNNAEGQGPPAAPESDIDNLPTVEINNIYIEQSADCPVCKEDFEVGEAAKKLPCSHFFHPTCAETWLKMHNSCPVCRKPINNSASSSNAR